MHAADVPSLSLLTVELPWQLPYDPGFLKMLQVSPVIQALVFSKVNPVTRAFQFMITPGLPSKRSAIMC